jgi:FdhD protein
LLAAVSAPSSLAVQTAKEFDMTLIGFLRNGKFNIYSGAQRVD